MSDLCPCGLQRDLFYIGHPVSTVSGSFAVCVPSLCVSVKWTENTDMCLKAVMLQSAVCLCVLTAQALQDPGVYGVIQSGDHRGRTCVIKWIKLNSSSDDVEVS